MAIKLEDKPNTVAPNSDYPYGNIKDNTGSNNGTPVNTLVYADFHQFFAKMMAESAIVYNDQPDNATNGFQYFLALQAVINSSLLIKKKIVEIGDWNMLSTANISVAHGMADFTKIRSIDVYIRNNGGTEIYPLNTAYTSGTHVTAVQGTVSFVDGTNVNLYRLGSGRFASGDFNSTSYNRGWIHITYVD